jgi:hypothetical protein
MTYAAQLALILGWPLQRAQQELDACAAAGMSPQYIVQCARALEGD